jgi:hypothetical protein
MYKRLIVLLFIIIFGFSKIIAQELNCEVEVNTSQIQLSDKRIFETLKTEIFAFLNTTKWTDDQYKYEERIECSIFINIKERVSADRFKASIQVQSRRPVYNSSYNSVVLNLIDEDFEFRYVEYQPFEFSVNTFSSNLTSVLAFYAFTIIAFDYDTFSEEGGTPFFRLAQTVVNNAQATSELGWKAFEGDRNRYWLVENLLSQTFNPLRKTAYLYHRKGLDTMTEDMEKSVDVILKSLEDLKSVHSIKPSSYNMQVFFRAKVDEIVNIFSKASNQQKAQILQLTNKIDPANGKKYQKIMQ